MTVQATDSQTAVRANASVQIGRTFLVEMPLEIGQLDSKIAVEADTAVSRESKWFDPNFSVMNAFNQETALRTFRRL